MPDYDIVIDDEGAPALVLAGATIIDPNAKSGNPNHEVGSGRFGRGRKPGSPQAKRSAQASNGNGSVERRRDAVVDAARGLEDLTPDGVREFVQRRWRGTRVLTSADIEAFSRDAIAQRIEDAVDALDLRLRKAVYARGGEKAVKISFPRGTLRATLTGLDGPQVVRILNRLRERGWTEEQVRKYVVRPFQLRDSKNV